MKILVVSQYFYPEQFRINDIVEELVKRGHKITVVTGLPNYPEGEIYNGYENAYKTISDFHGATVYRCKLRPRKTGKKNLALNYLSFVYQAKKMLQNIVPDFDVTYVYEPSPVTVALPAIWYKRKYDFPVFFYCMDQWPESVLGNGVNKKGLIYFCAKILSKYVYNNVDIIGNKCEEFSDYIHSVCGIDNRKMCVLYEHAENGYLSINEKPIDNGIIDFMFLGNIGTAQNCGMLVEAFSKIDYKNRAKLHFVGDGSYMSELKRVVYEQKLENDIVFHGKHPIEEINSFYELADVCLLSLDGDNACGITPPGKLYGYLAASRTIIAAINGPTKMIINESKSGYVVKNNDVEGLAKAMQEAIDSPEKLFEFGRNGRKYFLDNYTLEKHINVLEKHLYSLAEKRNRKKT